ncbi:MAG TPA: polysaccharide deacetylase family protein [Candidatus Acidoferrales bacterium]|nr:polysaccharide deacetylase family protein [Candidatus Acidoferrales bacterium]
MSSPVKIVVVLLAALVLGAGTFRVFRHESNLVPAIVTPQMNVYDEFSGDFSARLYRVVHQTIAADRAPRPKLIALTFDDGPYPIFTPLLLDELRTYHVPATFFLIGRDAQQWPEITRRIEADGNEVGDHTFTHPDLDKETPAQVQEEVLRAGNLLWSMTHDPAARFLMRPPHGRYTLTTLRTLQSIGYDVVLWTDDSGDWRTLTPQHIANDMIRHASAPDIVLLHNGKLATVEALPAVIRRFRAAGYRFVTIGEMLRLVSPQVINHPRRTSV